jgi:hypothetical protein
MLKQVAATLIYASTLTLLVGVFQYEPPVGSNIVKVQRDHHCPPGKQWASGAKECK